MAVTVTVEGRYDGRQIDKAIRDLDKLKKYGELASAGVGSSFAKTSLSIQAMGTRISAAGKSMSKVGTDLTRNVSIPLAAVAYASIKSAANFEVAMAQTQVATKASGAEMAAMSKLALKLGQDTVFSATDAANAMLNLAKGGLTKAQIQGGALKSTLDLAAASGIDLATAATTVTASMNTFGIKANEVGTAVDALAGAAAASNAEMPDLMMALRQAGQSASMSGLSIQETTGALAAFADKGVIGSDAGTSFKVMLQRLTPQSKQAGIVMKALGINFFDAAGNTKSLTEIAGELQKGMAGLTEQQRKAALSTMFGTDAIRAANIMTELGAKGMSQYVDATNKQGTAAKFANARMSGLFGVIEQLRGSIDTALIQNGQALAPTFTAITNTVKDLVNAYAKLSPQAQALIANFVLIGVALGPVTKALGIFMQMGGLLVTGLGNTVKAVGITKDVMSGLSAGITGSYAPAMNRYAQMGQDLGTKISGAATAISDFTKKMALKAVEMAKSAALWIKDTALMLANKTAIIATAIAQKAAAAASKVWAAGQWLLNAALTANPIGLVVVAIGALVAAFVVAWKNSETFRRVVTEAFNAIRGAASAVLDWFKANWKTVLLVVLTGPLGLLVIAFKKFGPQLLEGLWNGIKDATGWLVDKMKEWASGVIDNIKGFFGIASPSKETAKLGKNLTEGLAVGVEDNQANGKVKKATQRWRVLVNEAVDNINRDFNKKSVGWINHDSISSAASAGKALGSAAGTAAADRYKKLVSDAVLNIKNAARQKAFQGFHHDSFDPVLLAAPKLVTNAKKVGTQVGKILSADALKAMGLGFDSGTPAVESKAKKVADKIAKALAAAAKKAKKVADDIKQAMIDGLQGMLSTLKDQFDNLSSSIQDALDTAREAANDMVDRAQAGVDAMQSAYNAATGVLSDLRDKASSYASQIADSLRGAFSLKDALSSESGTDFLQNLRDQVKKFQTFSAQLTSLRNMGLNESSMQEIIQAGVEQGTQIAAAILAGGTGAVSEINSLEAMVTAEAQKFGDLLAQDKFGAELQKAQQGLNLAGQNLAIANQALNVATATRNELIRQIDIQQAALDALNGKQKTALDLMVENLKKALGDPTTSEGGLLGAVKSIIGTVVGGMGNLATMSATMISLQQQLDAMQGKISSMPAPPAPMTSAELARLQDLYANSTTGSAANFRLADTLSSVTVQSGAVQVDASGSTLTAAEISAIMNDSMLSLTRQIALL